MKNGNKPAYPCEGTEYDGEFCGMQTSDNTGVYGGLTKREMFAMAAMQGLLAKEGWVERISSEAVTEHSLAGNVANASIKIADELLKQLES